MQKRAETPWTLKRHLNMRRCVGIREEIVEVKGEGRDGLESMLSVIVGEFDFNSLKFRLSDSDILRNISDSSTSKDRCRDSIRMW